MSLDLSVEVEDRFWSKVEPTGFCWNWTGAGAKRYGRFKLSGKMVQAHRLAYEILVGPIPTGMHLDHLCRNKGCVNPDHLEPVTLAENNRRKPVQIIGQLNGLKTHCGNGHPLMGDNLRVTSLQRVCVTCRRQTAIEWYRRNRKGGK